MPTEIREIEAGDVTGLKAVIDDTGLFPSDLLPDMVSGFLAGGDTQLWLACFVENNPAGICFAQSEEFTDGTWNMLALGIHSTYRGKGIGSLLVETLEQKLREKGVRLLIVDTSGTEDFDGARAFYAKAGYAEEARIRDYWADGDDKITFRKHLVAQANN